MNRVTFKLADTGVRAVKGMAFVEDGYLVLKLHSAIAGLISKDRETIKIEPKVLESVTIKRGLRKHRMILKPWGPELLDAIPGKHLSSVQLNVRRKQRKILKALVQEINDLQA